jgi:SH3-like domain-containing protein
MRFVRSIIALGLVALGAPLVSPLAAQATLAAPVSAQDADGKAIARLSSGAKLSVGETKGAETKVTLSGWVDESRLRINGEKKSGVVNGESMLRIRASASLKGAVYAELRPGVSVTTGAKDGTWIRVTRVMYVSTSSLGKQEVAVVAKAPEKPVAKPVAKPVTQPTTKPATKPVARAPEPVPAPAPAVEAPQVAPTGSYAASRPTKLVTTPGGRVSGELLKGAIVEPLARDRGWVKVRIEGWVNERDLAPADSSYASSITAADLRAEPERMRGKTVRWEVQILSLQAADPLRSDFAKDEPYLLARGPGTENAILYLAVPPSMLQEVKSIPPLTMMIITARVRTGRSEPVGTPILDLKSISKR